MSEEEIKRLIDDIKAEIEAGWSIVLARKKVLKSDQNSICKTVMASQQYKDLLNEYVKKYNNKSNYDFVNGRLKAQQGVRKRGRNIIN